MAVVLTWVSEIPNLTLGMLPKLRARNPWFSGAFKGGIQGAEKNFKKESKSICAYGFRCYYLNPQPEKLRR